MKLALVSFGSYGDLEPLIPLAQEWARRGRDAYVAANAEVVPLAGENGVACRSLGLSVRQLLATEAGSRLMHAGSSSASLKILSAIIQEQLFAVGATLFERVKDADLLVINERYFLLGQAVAERLNIPVVQICFQPKGTTAAYRYPYYSAWFLRLLPPAATHRFVDTALVRRFLPAVNRVRQEVLSLPPLSVTEAMERKRRAPMIEGFSSRVFPPPADWPGHYRVSGYWHLHKRHASLPDGLGAFLSTDRPKVYVGFGSMLYDPERLKRMLLALADESDLHVVWSLNWSADGRIAEGRLSRSLYVVTGSDHDALFPMLDCVVHHGGAGTTATAFRHGKPQLITWFMLDQEFWARRVAALSAGINAGSFHRLSQRRLGAGIATLLADPQYRRAARAIADDLTAEDGPAVACDYIEQYAGVTAATSARRPT